MRNVILYSLAAAALLVVGGAVAWVSWDLYQERHLHAEKQLYRDNAIPLTVADLVWPEKPLDEDNAFGIYGDVAQMIRTEGLIENHVELGNWVASKLYRWEADEDLSEWILDERFDPVEDGLRRASERSRFWMPREVLPGESGKGIWDMILFASDVLMARAWLAYDGGELDRAEELLKINLRIAHQIAESPVVISQMAAMAVRGRARDFVRFLSVEEHLSTETIRMAGEQMLSQDSIDALSRALDSDRLFLTETVFRPLLSGDDDGSATGTAFVSFLSDLPGGTGLKLKFFRPMLRSEYRALLEDYRDLRAYLREIQGDSDRRNLADIPATGERGRFLVGLYGNTDRMVEDFMESLAEDAVAKAALAVILYHRTYDSVPRTLDVLVPEFLERIPSAPRTGHPVLYRNTGGGFIVYISTHREDNLDDNLPTPVHDHGDGLVWRHRFTDR